jgi:bifunctional NMN adenylyltransferase/nudix hydrolase
MQYDYLVFIGRFEPLHNGHQAVISRALKLAHRVIVLIGSAGKPRTIRNPWNAREREVMIRSVFPEESDRLIVRPLQDHLYNDALWVSEVQKTVSDVSREAGPDVRIGLIGHHKDRSSSYLEMFPQWPLVHAPNVAGTSASDLRDYLFADASIDVGKDLLLQAAMPSSVFAMLRGFREGPHFAQLVREYKFIKDYRARWAGTPYPPTFVTVDAVVIHSGHVLLVQRAGEPGRNLWALPGGFVDGAETLQTAVVRELREETSLQIADPLLKSALRNREVFDHPDRSLRGRTITHAFHFDFPAGELPAVRGGDDAGQARWVPISEAMEMDEQFYDDHFHILEHFLGRA